MCERGARGAFDNEMKLVKGDIDAELWGELRLSERGRSRDVLVRFIAARKASI